MQTLPVAVTTLHLCSKVLPSVLQPLILLKHVQWAFLSLLFAVFTFLPLMDVGFPKARGEGVWGFEIPFFPPFEPLPAPFRVPFRVP